MKQALVSRFWGRVTKTDTCWIWMANKNDQGYGKIRVDGRDQYAHRLSYEWAHGPIPAGLQIDHICHVRACVNPDHLRVVTSKQNHENLAGPQANSASGIRGVHWSVAANRWCAQVKHHGHHIHVGVFKELADAEQAVIATRNALFTHNEMDRGGVT